MVHYLSESSHAKVHKEGHKYRINKTENKIECYEVTLFISYE